MTFDIVFERIIRFMYINRNGNYRLMIGTDSQVHHKYTIFITGIVILNEGKGAFGKWSFLEEWIHYMRGSLKKLP